MPVLLHDVQAGLRTLFTVGLMHVYEHERNLNDGRFKRFNRLPQPHAVVLTPDRFPVIGTPMDIGTMVTWIAEHCRGEWHMAIYMKDVNKGSISFRFADQTDAVLFRLVFG